MGKFIRIIYNISTSLRQTRLSLLLLVPNARISESSMRGRNISHLRTDGRLGAKGGFVASGEHKNGAPTPAGSIEPAMFLKKARACMCTSMPITTEQSYRWVHNE